MPTPHVVQQGEHASRIAAKYGYMDFHTIWDDPANADLKEKRKNPNVLFPGDVVMIPDHQLKQVDAATTKRHRFVVSATKLKLRVAFLDYPQQPIAGEPCDVTVGGAKETLTTNGDGLVEKEIMPDAEIAKLRLKAIDFSARIGDLDPVDTDSGAAARLNNLGYFVPPEADREEDELRSAIEEFQVDHDMKPPTGENDAATQAKMLEVHGS